MRLASTTSTVGSGLFEALIPAFEEGSGIKVEIIAKGTGAALQLAREGRADVVLVHAREAEDDFVREGYGINRRDVMYNDFVLLGSKLDPAGVSGSGDIIKALKRIRAGKARFISRGDASGTHTREAELWTIAGLTPGGGWFAESKQGMLATLQSASAAGAYVLSDRGTYLFNSEELDLLIHVEGDMLLYNPYGVIAVNPALVPGVDFEGAMSFIEYITSREAQGIIARFGIERFGKPLFVPLAVEVR